MIFPLAGTFIGETNFQVTHGIFRPILVYQRIWIWIGDTRHTERSRHIDPGAGVRSKIQWDIL
jgi:hypothetical protein